MTDDVRQDTPELTPAEVAARLRWARRDGHPFYLWPEVPRAAWLAAVAEVGRVAGALLRGDSPVRLEQTPGIAGHEWQSALNVASFTSGMGPLLGWWHEVRLLDTDEATGRLLRHHLLHGRARAQRMRDALDTAVATLAAAGIGVTVLKGAHTAYYCFPEPGVRPMADLDLMVAARDVAAAETTLRAAGYALVSGSRVIRPYRSDWQPPGAPVVIRSLLVHHPDNPFTIDLHASLELDFFGVRMLRFDGEVTRVNAPSVAGAQALAQPLLAAHLAAHASQGLHNLTLIRLTELALLLQRDAERLFSWDELRDLIQRVGAERFVFPAFALVERFVPGSVEPRFLERLTRAATPALRGVLDRLTPATAQRLGDVALNERFMWGATPLEHARRVAHMLVPAGAGSLRRLRRIYAERAFRVMRGRVTVRGV